MTISAAQVSVRRAALRRITLSIQLEGGDVPASVLPDAELYAAGRIDELELVRRVKAHFGVSR